jgi:glyoxylase-like metal-dependent hydrolase (beta-lactamase superfamily II)
MTIEAFFDPRTWTLTYLVWDPTTKDAVVIDPVLDYDPNRIKVYDESVDKVLARVAQAGLTLRWVLETHAHADHLSGADLIRRRTGAKVAIGSRITDVQEVFAGVFQLDADFPRDGRQFDRLVAEGDVIDAGGALQIGVLETPGHTPACVTWHIGDAVFTGDALFLPDQGTGRCDFPNGSADQLYTSIRKLYALPDATRVFVGHDYQPGGRPVRWESTIGEEQDANVQLRGDTEREQFVAWRTARDKTLNLPNLLFQSLQVNIRAGALPPAEGRPFLKLPINLFDGPAPE